MAMQTYTFIFFVILFFFSRCNHDKEKSNLAQSILKDVLNKYSENSDENWVNYRRRDEYSWIEH